MKILDTYWFNSGGIVRVQTEYDGIRYFIRSVNMDSYSIPEQDARFIAEWGNTFPNDAGDVLFGVNNG